MNRYLKPLAVAGLTGALAVTSIVSSEAGSRNWSAAAGPGYAMGTPVGATAGANWPFGYYGRPYAYNRPYYGSGRYAYGQSYPYGPGFDYVPLFPQDPWLEYSEPDEEAHGAEAYATPIPYGTRTPRVVPRRVVPRQYYYDPGPLWIPQGSFAPGSYQEDLLGADNT